MIAGELLTSEPTCVPLASNIWYAVMAAPPSFGAVQLTVACRFPATADTPVGASGTVISTTLIADAVPTPALLIARTRYVPVDVAVNDVVDALSVPMRAPYAFSTS